MKNIYLLILSGLFFGTLLAQRPSPAPKQNKSILIFNAVVHNGVGETFTGAVGFENGKITMVQQGSTISSSAMRYDTLINAEGKHLYPGFILMNTTLGLREVDAVRATRDYSETGEMKPELRSVIAFNTDSKIIPTVRSNGVLIAQPTPRGGIVPGHSGLVQLDAWNWEDATLKMEDGLHINWPTRTKRSYPWEDEQQRSKFTAERNRRVNELQQLFEDAYAYYLQKQPEVFNQKLASMKGLFEGEKNLYVHANYQYDIIDAVDFFKKLHVKKIVIVGGYEASKILPFLKKNQLPIILQRVHGLPDNDDDHVYLNYQLPAILDTAGILFTVDYSGDMEAMGSRNLAFTAGTCVAHGMNYENAVKMITYNAAKISGIENRVGSIEVGKDATFFLSKGDALDMMTQQLTHAFIEGRNIDLSSHQTELYEMYNEKFGIKE
jgi:imidazolonepropionase-like amidohydrolase